MVLIALSASEPKTPVIKKSKPFVSAVVFSGGEPLMQDAIVPLAEFVREVGLAIGIHTNGCYPGMAN